ncbi:MAG: hypothetical protein ACREMB_04700 [Candidatus Rokuibacteriota bacterium]
MHSSTETFQLSVAAAETYESFESAGLRVVGTRTRVGTTTFPSVDEFVATEVKSTPLIERIGDDVYGRIREGAREALRPFTRPTGSVEITLEDYFVAARPRAR